MILNTFHIRADYGYGRYSILDRIAGGWMSNDVKRLDCVCARYVYCSLLKCGWVVGDGYVAVCIGKSLYIGERVCAHSHVVN